ncbi:hypothetical protein [Actinomadura madurae]|uniref:hypothetical protein n=1 Tax=Actinomadura madurae TaxID=1993 RepID=UPI000D887AE5|nr:hypothetical protein [Actinomadura madurae]SPT51250.1 Uncharacterised protein [Actinomadura madurae]
MVSDSRLDTNTNTNTGPVHTTSGELARTGGIRINPWSGVGMLVVAGLFVVWATTRPLRPESE